jgi:hypothetical protein
MRPRPIAAAVVATPESIRCCATGCGDKIKDPDCWRVEFADGSALFLERGCVGWFVNGHPDYGHPYGGAELFAKSKP